mmetsp:Transcript_7975/g.19804  ORF Transcript_7975/g.19804 Transcript_7975/m.19804 type:complete len:205 (-) Transcript_7975:407-1021(-)
MAASFCRDGDLVGGVPSNWLGSIPISASFSSYRLAIAWNRSRSVVMVTSLVFNSSSSFLRFLSAPFCRMDWNREPWMRSWESFECSKSSSKFSMRSSRSNFSASSSSIFASAFLSSLPAADAPCVNAILKLSSIAALKYTRVSSSRWFSGTKLKTSWSKRDSYACCISSVHTRSRFNCRNSATSWRYVMRQSLSCLWSSAFRAL